MRCEIRFGADFKTLRRVCQSQSVFKSCGKGLIQLHQMTDFECNKSRRNCGKLIYRLKTYGGMYKQITDKQAAGVKPSVWDRYCAFNGEMFAQFPNLFVHVVSFNPLSYLQVYQTSFT